MAKSRPQNHSQPRTGQSLQDQTETKENPDKPVQDEPQVVTKEDEHPEAPQVPTETKNDPQEPNQGQDGATENGDTDQDGKEPPVEPSSQTGSPSTTKTTSGPSSETGSKDYYYNNVGQRVIKPGGKITFRGEVVNNQVIVQEEVIQESYPASSKRPIHRLLYFRGQHLNSDQATRIAK